MLTFRPTGFPQMSWIYSKQLAVLRSISHHAAGTPNPGTDKSEHQRQGSGESSRMSDKAFSKIACRRWSIDYSDHHSWSQLPQPFHVLCFCTHPKTRHCRHPRALHGNRTTTVPQMRQSHGNRDRFEGWLRFTLGSASLESWPEVSVLACFAWFSLKCILDALHMHGPGLPSPAAQLPRGG